MRQAAASIGRRLKEAREKKSLTIEQIQKQTKIHSSVLIALEEGHASDLLTDTYVRSFLKKYTQVLGLPTGEILKEYFQPYPEAAAEALPTIENPMPEETRIMPKFIYFTGMAVLAIAALLIVAVIGGKMIAAFNNAKSARKTKQVSSAAVAKKNVSKPARSPQKKKPAARASSESGQIVPRSMPLTLTIKVKDSVLVTLKKDGFLIFSRVMTKGLVETVTAEEGIELEINKARALELTLNGRAIALPPKSSIFTLIITRKGVRVK